MNKINEILGNLAVNKNAELFKDSLDNFKSNFKRFEYLVEYSSINIAVKLGDFVEAIPEHILDVTSDELFLSRMFANGEVFENGKIAVVESVNEKDKELKVVFVFNKVGNLIRIEFNTEDMNLSLISEEKVYDLAMLEIFGSKPTCLKLVKSLKDCYTLTKATSKEDVFKTVISLDPSTIDRKAEGINKMEEHWQQIANGDTIK